MIWSFVALALVTNGLLLGLLYWQARALLLRQMQSTVLSIASTTATFLNGNLHKELQQRDDEAKPGYRQLVHELRRARDANRRPDLDVTYVFTLMPSRTDPSLNLFGVDAEESEQNISHLGDVFHFKSRHNFAISYEQPQVTPDFIEDQWGTWMVATAPIRDAAGVSVAAVGVDLNAQEVCRKTHFLFHIGLAALAVSVTLAVVIAFFLSRRIAAPLTMVREALEAIGKGRLDTKVPLQGDDEFGQVAGTINRMVTGLQERERLKNSLSLYVSESLTNEILSSGQMPELKGERRKITVLFADIRGFTTLSETMSPEAIVALLNEYFEKMLQAIFQHKGMLDKFLGDGLMALFGAPLDDPYQEEHAIRAALEMQAALQDLRKDWQANKGVDLHVGIGIHTGVAVVGHIGSHKKMEYTAIGDTVNLASRLEAKTKELGVEILVSDYSYQAVRSLFQFKDAGTLPIRGKSDAVKVYTVTST